MNKNIYLCPVCYIGNIEENFESIDSGICSNCGESSYFSETDDWRSSLIRLMLEFEFIDKSHIEKAEATLIQFKNADDAYDGLYTSKDELDRAIANATQI